MNINEKIIIKYFDIIVRELDDVSFFSINNILIDNKHLNINTQKEKEYLFELSDKIKTFGISRGYFLKNGDNGWMKLSEKGIDLKDSKKGVSKFTYSSNQKFEFTYDGIISYIKSNKIAAIILVVIVAFFGFSKIINEITQTKENFEKFNNTSEEPKSEDTISTELTENQVKKSNSNPILMDSLELPYLKNYPILDKGIYLNYHFNDLVLGGVNIDSLKINGRTYDGEPLEFRNYNKTIETSITQQPYIEIKYKGNFYSIEILGKHYSFDCIIKKNIIPTLNLK
ncbi:hypothetical protein KO506_04830 [Polaribacter vadi]|uniref:hypothetical protein n=1 Tax=Polaribacter TaxID=52959 RepID=UPI001C082E37|nr:MULTISPECIES: hypothetical protein [Polaribacter]MBU3010713.1 hypothetical protein [Polaribacter vadi]MDO6740524.1 hypothetical protein [Polaribacter sp. 1_MG-2023]